MSSSLHLDTSHALRTRLKDPTAQTKVSPSDKRMPKRDLWTDCTQEPTQEMLAVRLPEVALPELLPASPNNLEEILHKQWRARAAFSASRCFPAVLHRRSSALPETVRSSRHGTWSLTRHSRECKALGFQLLDQAGQSTTSPNQLESRAHALALLSFYLLYCWLLEQVCSFPLHHWQYHCE